MTQFEILIKDITTIPADAIVNSANESLLAGSGVCGTIHRAAGRELETECAKLGGCEMGKAKYTAAYNLPAKYVIHTVGPRYYAHMPEVASKLLASCYTSVSCGIYRYPLEQAVEIACKTILNYPHLSHFEKIIFAISSTEIAQEYRNLLIRSLK